MRFSLLRASIQLLVLVPLLSPIPASGQATPTIQTCHHLIGKIRVTPDSRYAVDSEMGNPDLCVTDLSTGKVIRRIQAFGAGKPVTDFAITSDGERIVANSQTEIAIFDLETGAKTFSFSVPLPNAPIEGWHLSPDDRLLITRGSMFTHPQAWNLQTGNLQFTVLTDKGSAKRTLIGDLMLDGIGATDISPDGRWIVGVHSRSGRLVLLDGQSGRFVSYFKSGGSGFSGGVSFTRDGRHLLDVRTGGNYEQWLQIWDFEKRELVRTVRGPFVSFTADHYLFSDATRILTKSSVDDKHALILWDSKTGQRIRDFETSVGDGFAATHPEDAVVAALQNSAIYLARLDAEKAATGQSPTIAAQGLAVPISDAEVLLFRSASKTMTVRSGSGELATAPVADCWPEAYDRRQFISILICSKTVQHPDPTISLFDVARGKEMVRLSLGTAFVDRPRYANGDVVAFQSGASTRTALIFRWDTYLPSAASSKVQLQVQDKSDPKAYVHDGDISPDGRIFVGSENFTEFRGLARVWSTETGLQLFALVDSSLKTPRFWKPKAAYQASHESLDGVRFVAGVDQVLTFGQYGNPKPPFNRMSQIKLWSTTSRKLLKTIEVGTEEIKDAIPGRSPSSIYALSSAGVIFDIDLDSGAVRAKSSPIEPDTRNLTLSVDGKSLYVVASKSVYIVRTDDLKVAARIVTSDTGEWLISTPEGFFNASRNGGELVSVVKGLQSISIDQMWQSLYSPDLLREKLAGDPSGEVARSAAVMSLDKVMESGAPPDVVILAPAASAKSASDIVEAEVKISDKGGGVGRIEWRVNGLTVAVQNTGIAPAARPAQGTFKQAVALDPGDNVIEVVAYNGRNLLASLAARRTVTWEPAAAALDTKPTLHVLAIGVDDYRDKGGIDAGTGKPIGFSPLALAAKDAKAFGAAMAAAGKTSYKGVEVTYAIDAGASLAALEVAITRLAAKIQPRDVFVFYAASHGISRRGRFYLIPHGYSSDGGDFDKALAERAVGQERLQDWIASRIKAKSVLILLDTCESGALVGGAAISRIDTPASEAAIGRLHEATGRPVLTAAASGQFAHEGMIGSSGIKHGLFTWALLDGLRNGDQNRNDTIELSELVSHVQATVPRLASDLGGTGRAASALRVPVFGEQTARFGSRGEDYALVGRLK